MNHNAYTMRELSSLMLIAILALGMPVTAHAAKPNKASKAAQSSKERLVLMPLRVDEADKSLQGAMETALVEGLQQKYVVFSGEQVAQKAREIFMKESRNTAKKECDETRCMQNIAEAFQAELIATANVSKQEGGYFLALSIQNIFDNKVEYSKSTPCKGCDTFHVVEKLKELSGAPAAVEAAPVVEEAQGPAMFAIPAVHGEQAGGVEFSGSGFLTVGVGKMLGGTSATVLDRNCPCFVADYAQGAVYDGRNGLQWGQDSKLGLQGTATVPNANFSMTAQAVARGTHNGNISLEWLYGSYQLTDNTAIQFGRKRLPMFYYSDIQDVGFALPWTHLPPQFYGWEMVNYNGVNIRHQNRWGEWAATINALAGNENISDSGYWKIYNGKQSRTRVKLNNIIGGDLTLARDWLETRLAYIQSDTSRESITIWDDVTQSYVPATDPSLPSNGTRQNIYGIALNMDPGDWIFRSELLYINRPGATYKDYAQLVGIGRRFGEWQLMATASHYGGEAVVANGGDPEGQENHTSRSLTLRYNLTHTSDIKAQLDSQKDQGGANWAPRYGDSRLLTLSYDKVF